MRVHSFLAGACLVLSLAACGGAGDGGKRSDVGPEAPRAELYREIELESPRPGAVVKGPILVYGRAIGPWYWEGAFTAKLLAEDGTLLAEAPAQAQGEWTSPDFVPFEASIAFDKGTYEGGTLVLENGNPSGEMETARTLRVDVRF